MICSKCGKEIANDSEFCEYCGAQINSENKNKLKMKRISCWSSIAFFSLFILGALALNDFDLDIDFFEVDKNEMKGLSLLCICGCLLFYYGLNKTYFEGSKEFAKLSLGIGVFLAFFILVCFGQDSLDDDYLAVVLIGISALVCIIVGIKGCKKQKQS